MICKLQMCDIPLCSETLIIGFIRNLPNKDFFVSFTDIATNFTKWIEAETDEFSQLSVDLSSQSNWFSANKVYEIKVHSGAGIETPEYCINALCVDRGEITTNSLLTGFVKSNIQVETFTLITK